MKASILTGARRWSVLPVGIGSIRRRDDGGIIGGVLRRRRSPCRDRRENGEQAGDGGLAADRAGHFPKILRFADAQHTNTVAGYHGPNHDGDAIVMGFEAVFRATSDGILWGGRSSCSAHRPVDHPVKMSGCNAANPCVASVEARETGQQKNKTDGEITMTEPSAPKGAWRITFLLFLFMVVNFADKIVVGLAGVPISTELKLEPQQFGLLGVLVLLPVFDLGHHCRLHRQPDRDAMGAARAGDGVGGWRSFRWWAASASPRC